MSNQLRTKIAPELGLEYKDPMTPRFEVADEIGRSFSYLFGKGDALWVPIQSTETGALHVADVGTGLQVKAVNNGNAPDTYEVATTYEDSNGWAELWVKIKTHDIYLSFKNSAGDWIDDSPFDPGHYFLNTSCFGVRIRNVTATEVGVFHITHLG